VQAEEPDEPECLGDALLVRLREGRISSVELARARRHAARCAACHQDLADAVYTPWTPPESVDEFRIVRKLGEGGMGVVYLARDTALDREVAIKFIAESQPAPRLREYFDSEAKLLASLLHPNIVSIFRIGQCEDHPYMVSEYVPGLSLVRLPSPLPWPRLLSLGLGLARGLAAAHRQGVLHRDVKLSNAIETPDGGVKLVDFGLAGRIEVGAGRPGSGARTVAGTPRYMAPEVRNGAPATPRSDLFSLGLVLYELAGGQVPGNDATGTRGDDATPEAGTLSDLDPDLAAVIGRCLRRDPAERFASADLLCEALERLAGRVPQAIPANPYRGLAPFERDDQALFFGREPDIQAVLERLRRQPLVLVVADSGAGKSSLCRAGVLSRASVGALSEGKPLATPTVTPGRRPLEALAAALAPDFGSAEEVARSLRVEPEQLARAFASARGESGVLLFVDQLEELLTLSDPTEAACAARFLGTLPQARAGVRVLLAVRADFLTRIAALPILGEYVEQAFYLLRPMTPGGLRAAIIDPAHACRVTFESEELVQHLVDAAARGSGELPLLSFALSRLWDRRDVASARITRAALDELGGVAGVLSQHADHVLARMDPPQRDAARLLLIRLVTAEGTGGERTAEQLELTSKAALRALVEGRLVQAGGMGATTYRIAHEVLIQRWPLLRSWLDDVTGHRAVRMRLEAAAAEWERLRRPTFLLWQARQLQEAQPVDRSALAPLERTFLTESSRRLARRQWTRRLSAILAVVAAMASFGVLRYRAYHLVDAQMEDAAKALARGRTLVQDTRVRREQAIELFDRSGGAAKDRRAAEDHWAEVQRVHRAAADAFEAARQSLEVAAEQEMRRAEAHRMLQDVAFEELVMEEGFHPQGAASPEIVRLQSRFHDEAWRNRVNALANLEIVTRPAGAEVMLERYTDGGGSVRLEAVPGMGRIGPTPIARLQLPPGSYLVQLRRPGGQWLPVPVLLARGAREQVSIDLPAHIPHGYAYVPPGWFLMGSDEPDRFRRLLNCAPLHRVFLSRGYLIGKQEVTFGDWLEYLRTKEGSVDRKRLDPQVQSGIAAVGLRWDRGWRFSFTRPGSPRQFLGEGEGLHYPGRDRRVVVDWRRLPLSGVSANQLQDGYLHWLDTSGRLPGARLCGEREWERAARGADARAYPRGDQLSLDDANIDVTYDRVPSAFGPDEVGSHRGSRSPFELDDMVGNAADMTKPWSKDAGELVQRGGAWYFDDISALSAYRSPSDPDLGDPTAGLRVCASFTPEVTE
jgi:formylglycine-generating enzyme required for sulfatase activity